LQTEKEKIVFYKETLTKMLKNNIEKIDFKLVKSDIAPFLVNANELRYFEKDFFLNLVES
jgi:hypothetical protein